MANGYMGKILTINLTDGNIVAEALDDDLCRDYIGGYGIGAKLLYDRIPVGADPLGPDNILGILTGPLTGTPAITGLRFVVVAKSPKTAGGWGDANCGGFFGPHMKFAGFDGALFSGISPKPVYLFIEEGRAELIPADDLWGMGVSPLEDALAARHGEGIQVCSIGPAGERMSLSACIMNDKERAAARSGLGAVMGSKKLKAVVVRGKSKVPLFDEERANAVRKAYLKEATGAYEVLNRYGTAGNTQAAILAGDAPVKNWSGSGTTDFPPEMAQKISDDAVVGMENYKPYGCWRCPIVCGGKVTQREGKHALSLNDGVGHKPEYETLAMFGSNLMNDDLPSIVKINEICNNSGLDTIAVGATIAYAVECYENGLLKKDQTDGLELTWGNADAIVALTEKIAACEGLGEVLADGVKIAWEKMNKVGTDYAVHIQGEEIPAHDPKYIPGLASTYCLAATPGRHTQGGVLKSAPGLEIPEIDKYNYRGQAKNHLTLVAATEIINAAGLCMFGYLSYPWQAIPDQLAAITGNEYDMQAIIDTGIRIFTMRHAFNLREGINPLERRLPGRLIGDPPLKDGNVKGITVDYKTLAAEFLKELDWDVNTTIPSEDSLRRLKMDFLIESMSELRRGT